MKPTTALVPTTDTAVAPIVAPIDPPIDPLIDADWDDDSPLPPRRPKLFGAATWVLAGLFVAAGCFTLGARIGRDSTPAAAASTAARATGAGGRAAGAGFGRAGTATGATTAGGGSTFGQVQLVDGNNIYIQDAQGNTIKITPAPTATITVNKPGTPADFKPGDNVVVQGNADASGNIAAATSIAAATTGGFGRGAATNGAPAAAGG